MPVLKRALITALWFVFLTLPFLAVRVNTIVNEIEWRWTNLLYVGLAVLLLSLGWQLSAEMRARLARIDTSRVTAAFERLQNDPVSYRPMLATLTLLAASFPWLFDAAQTNYLTLALIYVVLALGLNITVGLAGLLDLGYIAFFAIGAYTYAILNSQFGLGFWTCLPLGGLAGALFGLLLGFPILRLRGDYLAIVTLGFGAITKIVLENWEELTHGTRGIAGIDRPELFGLELSPDGIGIYIYYLALTLVIVAVFVTRRLKDSRLGRAWMALREDEIACAAMGVNPALTKLSAYAFGAFWAGLVGVLFAAKFAFINPSSFTFMDSVLVLSMVVLGGMGSIPGVIIAALALRLLPDYLQGLEEYRFLVYGAVMVLMMLVRPQGLISNQRRRYARPQPAEEARDV